MKIVILTVDQIYANLIVKELVLKYKKSIKLIIESGQSQLNFSLYRFAKKYILISGWHYFFIQTLKLEIYRILSKIYPIFFQEKVRGKFFSHKSLARREKIKIITTDSINDRHILNILRKLNPDLMVSVYFNQILGGDFIKIPKNGVINIHPAYLPNYRGVSPVFWALSNNEKEVGVAVHYIDRSVDTGRIIKRKKIKISSTDTEDSVYWKLSKVGIPLLISAIDNIKSSSSVANKGGSYYTIPDKNAVKSYMRKRKFFYLKDYIFN